MWEFTGNNRPEFARPPGPGQESVWDYPRPPVLVPSDEQVDVSFQGIPIASSRATLRVLETAHPPTYYLPAADINWSQLRPIDQTSFCEWKGSANYFLLDAAPELGAVCWQYLQPVAAFAALDGHVSFYPSKLDCEVNGEAVRAQPGIFYGGWITDRVVGPFKGEPGTQNW